MSKRLWWILTIYAILLTGCGAATQVEPTMTPTAEELHAGASRTDEKGVEQVWVPAGSFLMGADEKTIESLKSQNPPGWALREFASEMPQHEVKITKGYWIDKFEVTNQSFQAFVDDSGYEKQELWSEEGWAWLSRQDKSRLPNDCVGTEPDLPRVCVTWYEAEAYAHWRGGRLPSEAEWEYAARGPQSLIYPWGNDFDPAKANILDSSAPKPVGSYPDGVSWVGAHDMAGNAMEWVQDWLDANYYKQQSNSVDPTGPSSGTVKIEKGGWWGSNLFVSRSTYRHFEDPPTYQDHHIGFRVVTTE
jgi:formylglycine-generating enzyme required for sulfatase activity